MVFLFVFVLEHSKRSFNTLAKTLRDGSHLILGWFLEAFVKQWLMLHEI